MSLLSFRCAIAVLLSGIGGCCSCPALQDTILFAHFSKSEVTGVMINWYASGSNFTKLIGSGIETTFPIRGSDGDTYYVVYGGYLNSFYSVTNDTSLYDLVIIIPADSLSFKVTHILTTYVTCGQCPGGPKPALKSYYLDGIPVSAGSPLRGPAIVINK